MTYLIPTIFALSIALIIAYMIRERIKRTQERKAMRLQLMRDKALFNRFIYHDGKLIYNTISGETVFYYDFIGYEKLKNEISDLEGKLK